MSGCLRRRVAKTLLNTCVCQVPSLHLWHCSPSSHPQQPTVQQQLPVVGGPIHPTTMVPANDSILTSCSSSSDFSAAEDLSDSSMADLSAAENLSDSSMELEEFYKEADLQKEEDGSSFTSDTS